MNRKHEQSIFHANVNVDLMGKINSNQWWNNYKCQCECKKHICEKDYFWNPSTRTSAKGKYLASIMDDQVIMCDEIIDEEKTNFYILIFKLPLHY